MPVVRRIGKLLAYAAPFLFLTAHPVSHESIRQTSVSGSAAHAQGAAPARIDLYLPPARVTPPLPPPRVRRPAPVPKQRSEEPVSTLLHQAAAEANPAPRRRARPVWKPGLFTVTRVGRRLLYRKGYLGAVPVHLVIADLNDQEIKIGVMVAKGGIGTRESFESMINRARPAAAITGTFFGLRNGLPTGDLVVNGRAVYQGFVGTAVAFTEGNVVSFIPTAYKAKTRWEFFDGVMRAGPLLVQHGRIAVGPREEGFRSLSPAARRLRTAVGITPGRKLLLLAVKQPVSLWRLGKLMRELGAYHAVAMDGGSSTGLSVRGQIIARPARALTNLLVIYAYQDRYHQAKNSFLVRWKPGGAAKPPPAPASVTAEEGTEPLTGAPEASAGAGLEGATEASGVPDIADPAVPLPPLPSSPSTPADGTAPAERRSESSGQAVPAEAPVRPLPEPKTAAVTTDGGRRPHVKEAGASGTR